MQHLIKYQITKKKKPKLSTIRCWATNNQHTFKFIMSEFKKAAHISPSGEIMCAFELISVPLNPTIYILTLSLITRIAKIIFGALAWMYLFLKPFLVLNRVSLLHNITLSLIIIIIKWKWFFPVCWLVKMITMTRKTYCPPIRNPLAKWLRYYE